MVSTTPSVAATMRWRTRLNPHAITTWPRASNKPSRRSLVTRNSTSIFRPLPLGVGHARSRRNPCWPSDAGAAYALLGQGGRGRGMSRPAFTVLSSWVERPMSPVSSGRFVHGVPPMPLLRRSLLATALVAAAGLAHAADADVPKGPLSRNVVPSLVQLELKLDPKQANFTGSTRIQAKVAEATDVIWMHGQGLKIAKAEAVVGKKHIALTPTEADVSGVLKMSAAETIPAGDAVIEIAYEAPFGELQGAYRVKPDGNDYVVTQMEPLGARHTFPSFDEPSFKQPWDITLIVPEADVAVANSAEKKTEALPGGWKKVTFNRTEALPSY